MDIAYKLTDINRNETEAEKRLQFLRNSPIGTKYYKCQISGYFLRSFTDIPLPEYWGHYLGEDLATAKRYFAHDLRHGLDGHMNYGFMTIIEFTVAEKADGTRYGLNTGRRWVNDFGKWKSEFAFMKRVYDFTRKDYNAWREGRAKPKN